MTIEELSLHLVAASAVATGMKIAFGELMRLNVG